MRIQVSFMGPVLRPRGQDETSWLTLPAEASTTELLAELGYQPSHAKYVGVFRDGERLPRAAPLADGEHLTIAVAMGGG